MEILIPFVAGVSNADLPETRNRLKKMIEYIKKRHDDDFVVILSSGITRPTLARQMEQILEKMGLFLPKEKILYEEKSFDTTTQVIENVRTLRKIDFKEVVAFSNKHHLRRIGLLFARYGVAIKKQASPLGYAPFFRIIYVLFYEPIMYLATLLRLDILITHLTRKRIK